MTGDISYSIYMVNIPMLLSILFGMVLASGGFPDFGPPAEAPGFMDYLKAWGGATVFLLLVIGVASLTYRYIEKPWRARLKKFFQKKLAPIL